MELPGKKRGRSVILGEKIDAIVQKYILTLRERGGAICTAIVIAGANETVKSMDRTWLTELTG